MPKPGERAMAYGGTRKGKSTFFDLVLREFARKHVCEILILDTKPRFRAEETPAGFDAARYYKKQSPGPTIPGSVRIDIQAGRPLRNVFPSRRSSSGRGTRIAIAQTDRSDELEAILAAAEDFYERSDGKRARVLYADEMHDFFHPNGYPKDRRDIIRRVWRAGGERGLGGWGSAQRPRGVPEQCKDFSELHIMFQLNYAKDYKYLCEFGWPESELPPDTPHVFKLWHRAKPGVLLSRLEVPPRYLAELSNT